MRRRVRTSSAVTAENGGEQGFWPSYADMMSAVALILFFLMLVSYIQNLITGNDLQNTQEVLADTEARLALTLSQVEDAEIKLAGVTDDLTKAQLTLDEQEEEIAGFAVLLDEQAVQLDEQEKLLADQNKLIGEQEKYLAAANDEIVAMRDQMQTIAVLRLSILEKIRESIVGVMGDANKVSIGDNGSIILSEGVLFDLGSSAVKPGSRTMLDKLIDVCTTFLSNPENAQYVDSIVISGHTDITGTAQTNRALSTDRANSVLDYLLSGKNAQLDKYAEYFCAAGYGATRPVASNDTEEGRSANRRIEISIILRDETVLEIVEDYLAIEPPEAPKPSPSPSPAP